MNLKSLSLPALFLIAVTVATGCAKKEEPAAATQAAAKVNSEEITVHQINTVLARTPNIPPARMDSAKREILDRLIDQQIAKQAAIAKELDRSPNVMQRIEAARTEILANSYIESIALAVPKPTVEEMKKYYADHPELFEQRRIFNIQQIFVPSTEGLSEKQREQIAKSRSMEDVATWLNQQKIKFTASRGVRAAEAIPLDLLATLHAMKAGEMRLIDAGNGLNVLRVVGTQAAPVDEATAAPRIMQFLFNKRASDATASEMKKIRDKTEITLLGEFVETAATAEARTRAQTDAKAKELEKLKADAMLETQTRAEIKEKMAQESQANSDALVKAREARLAAQKKQPAPDNSKSGSVQPPPPNINQENIDKGLRGLR